MNEIPLALYIVICAIAILFMLLSFIIDDTIQAIIYSFISMVMSFICAMMMLNGSVVTIQLVDTDHYYIPITNTAISYFWDFIGLLMATCMVLHLVTEIQYRLIPIDGDNYESE